MEILFLHGWNSIVGGKKPTFLKDRGHEVINPAMPDDDFEEAVRIADANYSEHQPDVIVGSSRGGAVAVNMQSKDTPLVLLCPAWKNWGTGTTVNQNTIILHSRADDVIPFEDSEELIRNSGLSATVSPKRPTNAASPAWQSPGESDFADALVVIASLPLSAVDKAEAVRRLLAQSGE